MGGDIITISIGGDEAVDIASDSVAIGAFHAMDRGVLTVQAAGNGGPAAATVSRIAPWILLLLIDGLLLKSALPGNAVNPFKLNGSNFPLIFGKAASIICDEHEHTARFCYDECLDPDLVKGKIVLCTHYPGIYGAHSSSALGTILMSSETENSASQVVSIPASVLPVQDIAVIQAYINSTKMPRANILKSESTRDFEAPVVAPFSSRGPNKIIPDILKHDISTPGVGILASYSLAASPTVDPLDKRSVR
ncbi:hypothetical protein LguiA_032669 [Lonicera macranthoides]